MSNVMKYLNKRVMIDPMFSASEWQLYSSSDDPEMAQKSKGAAIALNIALKKAVNKKGATRSSVAAAMRKIMLKYSDCGARDTEPWYLVSDILDDIYGPTF
jgi:hypothetical protein